MIKLDNIWFRYNGDWVLKGVSLELEEGLITVILGPNGAGKTTLLKLMGLLLKPLRGRILIDGVDPWSGKERLLKARRSVVYVHEKPILVRGRVIDNIALGLKIRGSARYDEVIDKAIATAKMMGLEKIAETDINSLSAGQAQLVSIARAIAIRPKVLLLDEPFAHLDKDKRAMLAKTLSNLTLNERITIAIATHDTLLASKISRRAYYIEKGTASILNKKELYELI